MRLFWWKNKNFSTVQIMLLRIGTWLTVVILLGLSLGYFLYSDGKAEEQIYKEQVIPCARSCMESRSSAYFIAEASTPAEKDKAEVLWTPAANMGSNMSTQLRLNDCHFCTCNCLAAFHQQDSDLIDSCTDHFDNADVTDHCTVAQCPTDAICRTYAWYNLTQEKIEAGLGM